MAKTYSETWDLDSIFAGGSDSEAFREHLEQVEERIRTLRKLLERLDPERAPVDEWALCLEEWDELEKSFSEAWSFVTCLAAQDTGDEKARLLRSRLSGIDASIHSLQTTIELKLAKIPEDRFQGLIESPDVRPVAFVLGEMRQRAGEKMGAGMEHLASDLAVDGYHAWGQLYSQVIARVAIPFERNGKQEMLSAGQAHNLLSHGDPAVRREVFRKWEAAWEEQADLCAAILNHLAGFRLSLYGARGWDDVLHEPLRQNRMKRETLEAMWEAVRSGKDKLVQYLERKARLIGMDRLSWCDVHAPLSKDERTVSFTEAAHRIVEQFGKFSPEMADFAEQAFRNRWIEAENRPGKRTGGFCTSFPRSRQTRIFMTFAGTEGNVETLAHELGHAWHQHLVGDLHSLNQNYAMNVAETASTFAEWLMADASMKRARTREEKLAVLDHRLQRAVSFLMDIHARFLFETRFYAERKNGPVGKERLSELMTEAQKEAFSNALSEYHPRFWASKLHFYNTRVPFYNFPYTFGYLFSTGIFAKARTEGGAFAEKVKDLLRDTGRMTVEELADRHLGADLTTTAFWKQSVDLILADVDEFLNLSS
ncbi:M3 family oligoendopeptidase [Staphylospora marina]|uniref:M3 family oligoendopeptidase n=1 Tax=Staphylospora marina TaxID=2490858 RepID=UPI000F5BAD92|nr:M3 family oligoendopeptidase [Staphylospora marina]